LALPIGTDAPRWGGEICCELLIFVNGVAAGFEARLIAERIEKHFALVVSGMTNLNRDAGRPPDAIVNLVAVVSRRIGVRTIALTRGRRPHAATI
jgi:hypothetical protein